MQMLRTAACVAALTLAPTISMCAPVSGAPAKADHPTKPVIKLEDAPAHVPQPPQVDERGTEAHPIIVRTIPEPADEAKAQQDKWIAVSTVLLAVVTTLLTIFTGLLWWWTKQLARDAIDGGKAQAESTKQLLEISRASADAAKNSADIAAESNRLARELFLAEHRPWLTVEVVVEGPLTWSDGRVTFPVKFVLKNIGATPILKLAIAMHLCPLGSGAEAPNAAQLRIWGLARNAELPTWGDPIFPGMDASYGFSFDSGRRVFNELSEKIGADRLQAEGFKLAFVGSVDYQFTSTGERGATGFIFDLERVNSEGGVSSIFFIGIDVPRPEIRIKPSLLHAPHID